MPRLVTFGCSFTYGQGLPDCHGEEFNFNPSKFAWPSLVAKSLSLECVNYSFPGRCNKNMMLDVLRANIRKDDIVALLWASTLRGMIFNGRDSAEYFLPSSDDSFNKRNYYNIHNNYDLAMQSMLDIHHTSMFLTAKNIKFYNFFSEDTLKNPDLQRGISVPLLYIDYHTLWVDYALDQVHPGVITQKNISNSMLEYMSK